VFSIETVSQVGYDQSCK